MNSENKFASRLRQLREKAGLSQTDLARELNVSRGAISYYENGDRIPNIEFLMDVAGYFNVPVEFMLGLRDNYQLSAAEQKELFFLSDQALSNLLEVAADDGELLNEFISHEYFIDFFDYLKTMASNENIQFGIFINSIDTRKYVPVTRENAQENFILFNLTNLLIQMLESITMQYRRRTRNMTVDKKSLEVLEARIEVYEEMQKEMLDELQEKRCQKDIVRTEALKRLHASTEGEEDGNDPEAR